MATYWRIFYDKEQRHFVADDKPSECQTVPGDSTTAWFIDRSSALNAIKRNNKKDNLKYVRVCKDCNESYWTTEDEVQWYTERNLFVPRRCSECRQKRKNKGGNET